MATVHRILVGLACATAALCGCGSDSKEASDVTTTAPATSSTVAAMPNGTTNTTASPNATTTTFTATKPLPNGLFVGRFSGVQTDLKLANLTVECPEAAKGTYRVNLALATFDQHVNQGSPGGGHVEPMTIEQWAPWQEREKWRVTQTDANVYVISSTAAVETGSVCADYR
jgi:hypothetical protein